MVEIDKNSELHLNPPVFDCSLAPSNFWKKKTIPLLDSGGGNDPPPLTEAGRNWFGPGVVEGKRLAVISLTQKNMRSWGERDDDEWCCGNVGREVRWWGCWGVGGGGAGNARVNRWDGGFDGLKRIRKASGNKRQLEGKSEEEQSGTIEGP